MHKSAMNHADMFFKAYALQDNLTIAEIGSQDVNGSLRNVKPATSTYVGYDFESGKGVDVVLTDPVHLPAADNTYDMVVSSSCFEHASFFWLNFLEIMRILKPSGVFYMQAPCNGAFHRYPIDAWRFYPDSGPVLAQWGKRCGYKNCEMLETFIGKPDTDFWKDFVAIYIKDANYVNLYPNRIIDTHKSFMNGMKFNDPQLYNYEWMITE